MISYAPLEEVVAAPAVYHRAPVKLKEEEEIVQEETECYYVSVVFICLIIIISLSDILKNK